MDKLAQAQAQVAQILQMQQLLSNPAAVQQLLAATQAPPAPVQQSATTTDHAKLIDTWLAEFTQKEPDEGKQLSSSLTKFARFVQSKVAKPEPTPNV